MSGDRTGEGMVPSRLLEQLVLTIAHMWGLNVLSLVPSEAGTIVVRPCLETEQGKAWFVEHGVLIIAGANYSNLSPKCSRHPSYAPCLEIARDLAWCRRDLLSRSNYECGS
jgi:hypothetical protein